MATVATAAALVAGAARSFGYRPDGKRDRRKVSGQTKAEVKDKLKELHADLDVGVKTSADYSVQRAVDDWMAEGRDGLSVRTTKRDKSILKPVLAIVASKPLHELATHDVRRTLIVLAREFELDSYAGTEVSRAGYPACRSREPMALSSARRTR
jgi:hypothetical protein